MTVLNSLQVLGAALLVNWIIERRQELRIVVGRTGTMGAACHASTHAYVRPDPCGYFPEESYVTTRHWVSRERIAFCGVFPQRIFPVYDVASYISTGPRACFAPAPRKPGKGVGE
ncbi:MAG TPA: hypothetical protein GX506_12455 [Firmicutes bacterium]|nr:hypothetical protein [Bacillota bacterium]